MRMTGILRSFGFYVGLFLFCLFAIFPAVFHCAPTACFYRRCTIRASECAVVDGANPFARRQTVCIVRALRGGKP